MRYCSPHPQRQELARRRWRIIGQVQGVGFRPFVYRIAVEHHLTGFVRNDGAGVLIEGQGSVDELDRFIAELNTRRPALAVWERVESIDLAIEPEDRVFEIGRSRLTSVKTDVTVDAATCPDCVREMLDPADRRHGYGLINCTNCGPRFSIVRGVPYDRANTTMAGFEMCLDCRAEYTDASDRRFHAQPVACHHCGPRLDIVDPHGRRIDGDLIETAVTKLKSGQVIAIKGVGGFHLACCADDEAAVARLRKLKVRDRKPFALMVRSIEEARNLVQLSESAERLMRSPASPIILAARKGTGGVAGGVAPDSHRLGVMLPNTPIQHLLFARGGGLGPLVMTSANVSDEPLVISNDDAVQRLGPMCDAILWHDRPIERPVDDSVLIDFADGEPMPVRRARGFVPASLALPSGCEAPGLAVGGELKNTVAVVRGGRAILSQHIGDLTHAKAYESFLKTIRDMQGLFGVRPQWVAHDLHPVYLSTQAARQIAEEMGIRLIGVQHHHAHAAALMAEHGIEGPILAVVCDGVGYGMDGTMWGGELLLADLRVYRRLAHLAPMLLAGGDAAAKDTRRCGMALLYQAFGPGFADHPMMERLIGDPQERQFLTGMIRRGLQCVRSSGAGRFFDGVGALLGVCHYNGFEAEAAMKLESLAALAEPGEVTEDMFELQPGSSSTVDLSTLVHEMLRRQERGWAASQLSALFHDQFARAWEKAVVAESRRTGVTTVGLSGGVFCNQLLTRLLVERLTSRGMRVLRHRMVPPNDGGTAFGQAAVASKTMKDEE